MRLWDGRLAYKVRNSSTNSAKRLNNEAAVRAKTWLEEFGRVNLVPGAVVSGVFRCITCLARRVRDTLGELIDTTKP